MGRGTKPVRLKKRDAEEIQTFAERHGTTPAEVVSVVVASVDLGDLKPKENPTENIIGKCPG